MKLLLVPLMMYAQVIMTGARRTVATPPATVAYVQSCGGQASGVTTTVSCTLGAPVTAGDLLYVCVTSFYTFPMSSMTLSGDSGTQASELTDVTWSSVGSSQTYHTDCRYIASAAGGGTTITANNSGNFNYGVINVDEFSGVHTLDVHDGGATGSTTSRSSNSVTTTSNNELVVGYAAWDTAGNGTPGAGFSSGSVFPGASLAEYLVQSAAGSIAATEDNTSNTNWFMHVAAFKP